MATGDLTTLANVKTLLGGNAADPSADAVLGFLITAQSKFFIEQAGRAILSATYTETLDGHSERIRQRVGYSPFAFGSGPSAGGIGAYTRGYALTLDNVPVISITTLTVDGNPIPAGSGAGTSSQVDGYLLIGDRLELLGSTYGFTPGRGNVVITYVAGYATTPADVEMAVIELVLWRYAERDRRGQRSKSLGNGEAVYFQTDAIPPSVQSVIDSHRRIQF